MLIKTGIALLGMFGSSAWGTSRTSFGSSD